MNLQRQNFPGLFGADLRASVVAPSPQIAAKIIQHHKAGADAAFIASLVGVGLSEVLGVLDSLKGEQRAVTDIEPPAPTHEPEPAEPTVPRVSHTRLIAESIERNLATATREVTWPEGDVELNTLQERALRYLRNKLGLSPEKLAHAARTRPDQIERVSEAAPAPKPSDSGECDQ